MRKVLYKHATGRRLFRHPKVGAEVGLVLNSVERRCLERMGSEPEFRVRVSGVEVKEGPGEVWLELEPVSPVHPGPADMFTDEWWLRR